MVNVGLTSGLREWVVFVMAGSAAVSKRCTNYHTRGSGECEGCSGKWRG